MTARLALSLVGVAVAVIPGEPGAAQTRDTTARDTVRLPPVVVTATRRAADRFAVPLAITAVKREDFQAQRGVGLDEALALVPGVLAQSRAGGTDIRLVIRGFGARGAGDRSNAGTARGVRILLDGFPETEPDGRTSFDGIDLAAAHAIEIVRSNATALWGNAAGGVVNISTVPASDGSLFSLETAGGTFGLRRAAATAGAELGPGRLTTTLTRTVFDGWRDHSASERWLLNLALVAPLASRTELGVFTVASDNLFHIPGPLTATELAADPHQANAVYAQRDERRHNRTGRLGVRLDHDFAAGGSLSGALFVNPKYLQRSERGTFRDFNRYHVGGNVGGALRHARGARVTGSLMIGTDLAYQDGAIQFYSLTPTGTRGDTLRADKREGALNVGVYAQEELTISPRWVVIVGARYDDISYYYQDFLDPALDANKAFRGVTPKLGLTWRRTPSHSVYASVGGGIEAPAGNETDPAGTYGLDTVTAINPLLDPIRSTTYEIGTRHAIAVTGGAVAGVSYDVALYQTEVRNEIVPYRGGRFYFTAGSARRRGAEFGLTVQGRAGLALRSSFAYQDHRYVRYVVDSAHYQNPGRFADYGGNRVVGVPDVMYALSVSYDPSPLRPVQLHLALQGATAYFADDANQVQVPAYRVMSVTLGTAHPVALAPGLGLRGFVTVNNLFDRRYVASAFLNPEVVGGEPVAFEPGLPRNLVVGLSLERRP